MSFGERVRETRIALGLSQAQIAADLGVDQSTVAKWETGPNSPRPRALKALAERLNVSVAWLLEGEGSPFARAPAPSAQRGPAVAAADLPVYSLSTDPSTGRLLIEGHVFEYLSRPPQLLMARNAYAVFMPDESMTPRYDAGDVLYVNPNRPVTLGCCVIVQSHSEEGASRICNIGQVIERGPTSLTIRVLNPVRETELDTQHIAAVHRIVLAGDA